MNYDKLIHIATYAGKVMLENGAEIYRVEDTINRICSCYGAKTTDSFATPTGIIVSIYGDNNQVSSVVKRIKKSTVDLNKVAAINDLSRQIQKKPMTLDDLYDKIKKIDNTQPYSNKIVIPFAAITAASFSLMFGGNLYDFLVAMLSGFLIKILQIVFNKHCINSFFTNYICGALASLISIFFYYINFISEIHFSVIGAIMLLVPGLAITNAIRDIIAGDFLAGLTKGAEAFLVAIAIAAGTGSILSLFLNTIGGLSL